MSRVGAELRELVSAEASLYSEGLCSEGVQGCSRGPGVCTVRSNASWAMVTWYLPVDILMDRND